MANGNQNTALLLIDLQKNMLEPANPVVGAEGLTERLQSLLGRARSAHAPVLLVRNCGGDGDPDVKGTPGWELHPPFAPAAGEPVLDKTTCDTFASTDLDSLLRSRHVGRVVIAGLQSDWCVRETTQGALAHGYDVTLVSDGHSTYDGKTRKAAETAQSVNDEFRDRVDLVESRNVRF
ncbi:MAG TPA: cysteine hydrolase family protein [Candidatus Eisenbacteria bacterium]|nr:cysteine hydrolase family protein [Candidatus Eisenbacteria bacterium]